MRLLLKLHIQSRCQPVRSGGLTWFAESAIVYESYARDEFGYIRNHNTAEDD